MTTACVTTMRICGARKISMNTVAGSMRMTTAGFGDRASRLLTATTTGRLTGMVDGSGSHLMAGPGSPMNRGVGRRITTVAGFTTTTTGLGVLTLTTTRTAVGGDPFWQFCCRLILGPATVGIRSRIITMILTRDITIMDTIKLMIDLHLFVPMSWPGYSGLIRLICEP